MAETQRATPKNAIPGVSMPGAGQSGGAGDAGDPSFDDGQNRDASMPTIYGVRRSTLMMVIMFLVGIGWVANETRKTRSLDADGAESSKAAMVEIAMPEIANSAHEAVRNDTEGARDAEGPLTLVLAQIETNPFDSLIEPPEPVVAVEVVPDKPVVAEAPEVVPAPNFSLDSILASSAVNYAWINGKMCSEGDTIAGSGGWAIEKIHSDRVVFRWKSTKSDKTETHVLHLKSH